MSLLINESYVNPNQSLWLSATNGGTVDGNLTVTGTLDVKGNATFESPQVDILGQLYIDGANASAEITFGEVGVGVGLNLSTDPTQTDAFIENDGTIYLGRVTAGTTANTSFTSSAPTTNGDVLAVGGRITTAPGGGITPLASSTALTNVGLGAGAVSIAPTPAIPITTGKWYDMQVTGYWVVPIATTPAPLDQASVSLFLGAGVSPGFYAFSSFDTQYPGWTEDTWTPASFRPFQIRARLLASATLPNIVLNATLSGTGLYPSGLDIVVQSVSAVALS